MNRWQEFARIKQPVKLIALWTLVVAWPVWYAPDLCQWLGGPAPMRVANWTAKAGQYVSVRGGDLQRLSPFTLTLGKEPYARYGLLHEGGQTLLICSPKGSAGPSYSGVVEPLSRFEKMYLLPRLRSRHPAMNLIPYRLNAVRSVLPLDCVLTIAPITLVFLVACWQTRRRRRHVGLVPSLRHGKAAIPTLPGSREAEPQDVRSTAAPWNER